MGTQSTWEEDMVTSPCQEIMVIKEAATGIQQPEHRQRDAVFEHDTDRRNQVPIIMGMGGGSTTSPQEPDNNRQAQSKNGCCISSSWESDNVRQAQSKQRGVIRLPRESDNYRQAIVI